jgi:membrane protein implicated in regulation of membrane protease activity
MSVVFVACFVAGLVLAVYVMLHGVERPTTPSGVAPHEARGGYDPASEPSPMLNAQNAAAFVTAFGACGYLLTRFTSLGAIATVAIAAAAALGMALASASLLAAWVIPGARREEVDERYLLQGHPARVTAAIGGADDGEITYEVDGRGFQVRARSWDGAPIDAGADVAIERVEGGVAYVERWAQVEARL